MFGEIDCGMANEISNLKSRGLVPTNGDGNSVVVIDVDDEGIGVCGGSITLDNSRKPRMDLVDWEKWTTLEPMPIVRPNVKLRPSNLRPIVIDGSNVSFYRGIFSGERLETCVRTFQEAGHVVKAFMPEFRTMHSSTREPEILDKLVDEGFLILTPSRSVEGVMVTPYDDRYIVDYADETGAVIVSRDKFQDIQKEDGRLKQAIDRKLGFMWFQNQILFPRYPTGKLNIPLAKFLAF